MNKFTSTMSKVSRVLGRIERAELLERAFVDARGRHALGQAVINPIHRFLDSNRDLKRVQDQARRVTDLRMMIPVLVRLKFHDDRNPSEHNIGNLMDNLNENFTYPRTYNQLIEVLTDMRDWYENQVGVADYLLVEDIMTS